MMLRIAFFVTILLVALVYAVRKGGGPERAMAAVLVAMLLTDQALHLFVPVQYLAVDTGHLLIDILAAVATLAIALLAHRFWPMIAAALQFLPLLAHSTRAIEIDLHSAAYLTMQVAGSWPLAPLLVVATWRHQQRLARNGSDPSWVPLSRRSNPTAAKR
ncbi:MAG: hypothetical protein ACREBX_13610 [Sphingopyxis sp.]